MAKLAIRRLADFGDHYRALAVENVRVVSAFVPYQSRQARHAMMPLGALQMDSVAGGSPRPC
jgi:hypothetical protein